MAEFGVVVAGLGYFSQFHLAAWQRIPGVQVLGAADPDAARRSWAEETFGLRTAPTLEHLLDRAPEIVDIVAPPAAHRSLIGAALAPGRTVICQKPFCQRHAEAVEITALAEAAGTTLVVHENFRFQPWYRRLKRFLDEDRLGTVWRARFALRPGDGRGPDAYLSRQPAFQTMERFLLHETGVHFIDLFRWLFGEVTAVYADLRRLNPAIRGEDAGYLLMDHASGVQSLFDGNRLSDHRSDLPRRTMGEMEIEGEGGQLRLDGAGVWRIREFGADRWEVLDGQAPVDDSGFGGGAVAALQRHVIQALTSGEAPENVASAYLRVIEIEEAAYRAADERRRIPV